MARSVAHAASARKRTTGINPSTPKMIAAHLKMTFDLNIRKLRIIAPPDLALCSKMLLNRRDSRVFGW